ncbi:hypothetical protein DFS34DRAFT_611815 [Phlyctochytrium arcticum]|nr:hypothetical protein DFS34DRAFT_611815 [Phlyctochytrium arcticum]
MRSVTAFLVPLLALSAAALPQGNRDGGSSGSNNTQDYISAASGRTGAGSVVAGDQWLLFGGSVRTSFGSSNGDPYANFTRTIATSVGVVDLGRKQVRNVNVASTGGVNRLNSTGQTCEYDSVDKKVYCFGGRQIATGQNRPFLQGVGVFDPASYKWDNASLPVDIPVRYSHSSTVVQDKMYIFGGRGQSGSSLNDIWVVEFGASLKASQYFISEQAPAARSSACFGKWNDTAIFMTGGTGNEGVLSDAWAFSTDTGRWTEITDAIQGVPLDRTGASCALVGDKFIIYGGLDSSNSVLDDTWSIDPKTLQATQQGGNSVRRQAGTTGAPSPRAYPQFAAVPPYLGIFGGQNRIDPNLNEWVADDGNFYFYNSEANNWVARAEDLSFAPVAAGSTVGQSQPRLPEEDQDGCGNFCMSQGALAGLLGGLIALVAAGGLFAAFGLAVKEARRVRRNERQAGYIEGKSGQRDMASAHQEQYPHVGQQQYTSAGATHPNTTTTRAEETAILVAPATAFESEHHNNHHSNSHNGASTARNNYPLGAYNPTSPAPQTPHRSDSRRRVHSPLSATSPGSPASPTPSGTGKFYRVLWKATPNQPDEIAADVGDILEERRLFADGWVMVRNVTQGNKTGMIPFNILHEIKEGEEGAPKQNLI